MRSLPLEDAAPGAARHDFTVTLTVTADRSRATRRNKLLIQG